ncbi:MAG: murein L,D-transpeptidase catalytic domain family protein [Chitinophagaceae bacterium]|nr:murein L,D-transpeptidase catalytic domain family protein [Chitinophagaceae bacterium]
MRRPVVYIAVSSLFFLLSSFSAVNKHTDAIITPLHINASKSVAARASLLYDLMELDTKGLSKEAFEYAYRGYLALLDKGVIRRSEYLTICDMSQSSRKKRLYLIDIINNKVVMHTYVAHGRNSGGDYARRFSNKTSSHQSSLGFYLTRNTYSGEHGLSLRLEGLEPGFNDKAYRRAIVVHGASYIGEGSAGRSYGCPAVPAKESKTFINTIKNGTCLFIYHPQANYLKASKILNG